MLKRIMVGVDGSESARKAAAFASSLAKQTGARLFLVMVLEPPHAVPFMPMEGFAVTTRGSTPEEVEAGHKMLKEVSSELPPAQVETRIEFGEPAEVLVQQAGSVGADLIIVGARGLGPASRWLMGSVSDRRASRAVCSHSRALTFPSKPNAGARPLSRMMDCASSCVAIAPVACPNRRRPGTSG